MQAAAAAEAAAAALAAATRRRNLGTGAALFGFCGVVYAMTTERMRTTDVLGDLGDELDQVRKLKEEHKGKGGK